MKKDLYRDGKELEKCNRSRVDLVCKDWKQQSKMWVKLQDSICYQNKLLFSHIGQSISRQHILGSTLTNWIMSTREQPRWKMDSGKKILYKYLEKLSLFHSDKNKSVWGKKDTYLQVSCSRNNDFKLQEEFCGTSRKEILIQLLSNGTDYFGRWRAWSIGCF